MAEQLHIPEPSDLALEQLLIGLILHHEEERQGAMEAIFRSGAGFARFSVEADIAYRDLCETIRGKARRAGLID